MIQTIVVPLRSPDVDPGQGEEAALRLAGALTDHTGAEVRLVSVLAQEPDASNLHLLDLDPEEALALRRAERLAYLGEVAGQLPAGRASTVVRTGDVVAEVVAEARAHPAPLIVLSRKRGGALSGLLQHDIASRVRRNAPCPVIVTRPPTGTAGPQRSPIETILVPIDRSPMTVGALNATLAALGPATREIHLLHVVEPLPRVGARGDDALAAAERPAQDYLAQIAERVERRGPRVTWEVRRGRRAEQIGRVAVERGGDLIALATPATSVTARFFRGSLTESVLDQSRVPPVLIWTERALEAYRTAPESQQTAALLNGRVVGTATESTAAASV